MNAFFSMDGPFYKIGSIIADIMILSFIWILFSLPIFTIGASSTALYYVMTRRISNREGYLWRDYWTSFKSNFKQTTITWLIFLVLAYILYVNISNVDLVGDMKTVVLPIQVVFSIELTLMFMYIIPINARFEIGLKDSFKTAFFMANRHLLTSLLCLIIALGVFVACYVTIILFLFAAGLYCYLTSFLFLRVFKKYRPEIDMDYAALEQFNADREAEKNALLAEAVSEDVSQNDINATVSAVDDLPPNSSVTDESSLPDESSAVNETSSVETPGDTQENDKPTPDYKSTNAESDDDRPV